MTTRSSRETTAGMLVVTIDHLPAWMLSCYGSTWVATPALDGLAARGIVFDRLIVPVTDPLAADAGGSGVFESLLPMGAVRPFRDDARGRPLVVTDVPGWEVPAAVIGPEVEVRVVAAEPKREVEQDEGRTGLVRLIDAAVEAVSSAERRFVWVHAGGLGVAWDAPLGFRSRYIDPDDPAPPVGAAVPSFAVTAETDPDLVVGARQVFAGQLTLLDGALARLFARVYERSAATGHDWHVLVAGVRGLPLGLHDWVGVGGGGLPYAELVHVPGILVDASGRMAAQRYGGLVIPADIGCTLAELVAGAKAAFRPDEPWRGASLADLLVDWSAPVRDRVVVVGRESGAVVTPAWHCLASAVDGGDAPHRVRLFAKPDDYFEQVDVANRCGPVAGMLGDVAATACGGDPRRAWREPLPDTTPQ